MTRRLHACLTCSPTPPDAPRFLRRGKTRHKDRICAPCRRGGVRSTGDEVIVPIDINFRGFRGRGA